MGIIRNFFIELLQTAAFDFRGNIVLHPCCRSPCPWGINKRKGSVIPAFVNQAQRHFKLFLGFIGKTDDDVRGERTAGNPLFDLMEQG